MSILVLLLVLVGCGAPSGASGPQPVVAPSTAQVESAVSFGALAPLPPGSSVAAVFHEPRSDPYMVLAVRMPSEQVEPFLAASRMGAFDPYARTPNVTAFDYDVSGDVPVTAPSRVLNDQGSAVWRSAAAETETETPDLTLLHLWLITT